MEAFPWQKYSLFSGGENLELLRIVSNILPTLKIPFFFGSNEGIIFITTGGVSTSF